MWADRGTFFTTLLCEYFPSTQSIKFGWTFRHGGSPVTIRARRLRTIRARRRRTIRARRRRNIDIECYLEGEKQSGLGIEKSRTIEDGSPTVNNSGTGGRNRGEVGTRTKLEAFRRTCNPKSSERGLLTESETQEGTATH